MGVIWHKVRTILAVLSIAVGVFAVGAIFGMVDQLLPGMDRSHRASQPAHISLTLSDRITRNTAHRLTNIEGGDDIEVANTVSVRYGLEPDDEWQAGFLQMRADYDEQQSDVLRLQAVERLSSEAFGLELGDKVIFELDKTDRVLPLGALVAFGLNQWFLNAFNIDYDTFQVSLRAIGYQAGAATLIPALVALWPVLSGATMTVRAAIATYDLGGDFGSSRLDRLVEQFGRRLLSSSYAIALGNMFRRKDRLTLLVLIGAGTMLVIVMSLSTSLIHTLDTDLNRRQYNLHLGFEEAQSANRVMSMLPQAPGVADAELWFTTPAAVLKGSQRLREAGIGAEVIGLPAGSDYYRPLLTAERWFRPGDGRVIVISQDMAEDHHLRPDDTVTLNLFELGDVEHRA